MTFLVSVHVMKRKETLRFKGDRARAGLSVDEIKPRGLLLVPVHAVVKTALRALHREELERADGERVLHEDEVVGSNPEAVVVDEAIVRLDASYHFRAFEQFFFLDLACTLRGGNLDDVVSRFAAYRGHDVEHVAIDVFVGVRCSINHLSRSCI